MPNNAPLNSDHVFMGVIYLKGETQYPDALAESLANKKDVVVATSPIFRAPAPAADVPPVPVVPDDVPQVPDNTNDEPVAKVIINPHWTEEMESHELPADFPFREDFVIAGYDSVERVFFLNNYTEVNGIGPARAMQVTEWMNANVETGQDMENPQE